MLLSDAPRHLRSLVYSFPARGLQLSQTAEGSALSVQLLEEREKQLTELLALEKLSRKLVRTVRKADKAQDRIRFRIFSCQVCLLAPLQPILPLGWLAQMHGLQNPLLKWMSSSVSQNRHEEAIEFGDLSDVSEGDSDEEEDFELMSLEEIQALLVTLNAQHEEKVATARTARERLQNEVSTRHHPDRHHPLTSGVQRSRWLCSS